MTCSHWYWKDNWKCTILTLISTVSLVILTTNQNKLTIFMPLSTNINSYFGYILCFRNSFVPNEATIKPFVLNDFVLLKSYI